MKPTISSDLSMPTMPAATEAPMDADTATESTAIPEVSLPADAEETAGAAADMVKDAAEDAVETTEQTK